MDFTAELNLLLPSLNKYRHYDLEMLNDMSSVCLAEIMNFKPWMVRYVEKNQAYFFPLLIGMIVYRQLDHIEKHHVLELAQLDISMNSHEDRQRMIGFIQETIACQIANPSWLPYCLDDREIIAWHKLAKVTQYIFSVLGVNLKFPVQNIMGGWKAVYNNRNAGVKGAVKALAKSAVHRDFFEKVFSNQPASESKVNVATALVVFLGLFSIANNDALDDYEVEMTRRGISLDGKYTIKGQKKAIG